MLQLDKIKKYIKIDKDSLILYQKNRSELINDLLYKDSNNNILYTNFMNFLSYPYKITKFNIHILDYDYIKENSVSKSCLKIVDHYSLKKIYLINPDLDFLETAFNNFKDLEKKQVQKQVKLFVFFIP